MFNDLSSPAALIATRRSGKPRDMVAPGPDADQLATILASAIRVPDHGKLVPWRIIVIDDEQRDAFAALLLSAYRHDKPDAGRLECEAVEAFARFAPCLIAVVSQPVPTSRIPVWEQELSAGALCQNILLAAHAHGFVGSWQSGWAAYDARVTAALAPEGGRIAGFIFIGTSAKPLEERPRPDYGTAVSHWQGDSGPALVY